MKDCQHRWAVHRMHVGIACMDCAVSGWDWAQEERRRLSLENEVLRAELTAARAVVSEARRVRDQHKYRTAVTWGILNEPLAEYDRYVKK